MQNRDINFWIEEAVRLYFEGYGAKEAIYKAQIMKLNVEHREYEINRR